MRCHSIDRAGSEHLYGPGGGEAAPRIAAPIGFRPKPRRVPHGPEQQIGDTHDFADASPPAACRRRSIDWSARRPPRDRAGVRDTICQPISGIDGGLPSTTPHGRADATMRTIVYADGGCDPNPGPGGWGVVIAAPDGTVELCGGEPGTTTNNRMELTAAIKGLEHFPAGAAIEMRCDSQYVVKSVTEWMRGWKAKGWRTTTGEVKNIDLMKRLDELNAARDVKWTWVRGHAGDRLNERADALVHRGRREAKLGKLESRNSAAPLPAPAAAPASPSQKAELRIDLALGLQVTRAAKAAGVTPDALVEDAIRLYLEIGPSEVARLRSSRG